MTTPSTIGKYVLQKRLGGGHFGEVFLAHDRALACNKAIKLVQIADTSEIMQKLGEAQILDKCRHKHIVQINEANVFNVGGDKILVLDLEYLPEGSLESEMQNRWISAKEACSRIACQTCSFCGAVFHVEVPGQKGHEESEEYYCPECGTEYRTRASNSPRVTLVSPRTDGLTTKNYPKAS